MRRRRNQAKVDFSRFASDILGAARIRYRRQYPCTLGAGVGDPGRGRQPLDASARFTGALALKFSIFLFLSRKSHIHSMDDIQLASRYKKKF
jgi:hypothetical protein